LRLTRIRAVTKRIFRDLINDKRTLVAIVVTPIITMILLGVAVGTYVSDVSVIIVNKDEGYLNPSSNAVDNISAKIIANMDTKTVKVKYADDVSEAIDQAKHGEAVAVVVFPPHFSKNIHTFSTNESSSGGNAIKVMVDKSSFVVSDAVKNAINDAVFKTLQDAIKRSPVSIDMGDSINGNIIQTKDYMIPGFLVFSLFLMTTTLTTISLVEERGSGTLSRIFATPLLESEAVLGYTIAFSFVGILQSVILLAVGILGFNFAIVGSVLLVFVILALLAVVSQSLGILLSSTAKRPIQVSLTAPIVFLIVLLVSGVSFPLQQIPSQLRPISYLLPTTYAVDAVRSVALRGEGFGSIWGDILVLCAFAIIFLTFAIWSLKITKSG
jgi:ABC-2 type transport system permease protein